MKCWTLLSIAPLMFAVGCSSGNDDKGAQIIKVKGDPIAFVENTKASPHHTFAASFFEDLGVVEVGTSGFVEIYQEQSFDEVKKDQSPDKSELGNKSDYQVVKMAGGLVELRSSDPEEVVITFKKNGNGYQLYQLQGDGETLNASSDPETGFQIIHNSSHESGLAISSLVYYGNKGQRTLANLVVMNSKKPKTLIETISGHYNYLFGLGTKLKWSDSQNIRIQTCGTAYSEYRDIVSRAAKTWTQNSSDTLKLTAESQAKCPPFSDLNTQTFNYVSGYVEFPELELGMNGVAIVVPNYNEAKFVDGDVFVLQKEIEGILKVETGMDFHFNDALLRKDSTFISYVERTATHELGHFLGLHHQFDPAYRSIMSYDDVRTIQNYDREAIKKLYTK